MRKSILIIAINILILVRFCCGQTTDEELFKYPLKSVYSLCQADTNKIIFSLHLIYDKEHRLIQLSSFFDTIEQKRIIYNYNYVGLLKSKEFYSFNSGINFERKRVFEYNQELKLVNERYDDNKGNNTKYNYTYSESGKIITKKEECNFNTRKYNYEYDKYGKLVHVYRDDGLEISYAYTNGVLTKETNHRNNNEVTYEYNDKGLLILKKENNKIIEKNVYQGEKLIKRWTSYFGIDPCFDTPCCSQYLRKYEYYE